MIFIALYKHILVILQSKILKYLPKYYNIFIEKSQANYVFSLLDFLQVANSGRLYLAFKVNKTDKIILISLIFTVIYATMVYIIIGILLKNGVKHMSG